MLLLNDMQVRFTPGKCLNSLVRTFLRERFTRSRKLRGRSTLQDTRMPTNARTGARLFTRVTMSNDGEWFECECGQFAHMGMLCCHALKVMDYVGVKEIPKRHILKRWTKYARDILPRHPAHFQRDQAVNQSFTCWSLTPYLHAMELIRLGD